MTDERQQLVEEFAALAERIKAELRAAFDALGFPRLTLEDIEKATRPGGSFEGYEVGRNLGVCLDNEGYVLFVQPYIPVQITPVWPEKKEVPVDSI